MRQINIVLPHQLFKNSPLLNNNSTFYLIEEYLFFKQYPFHKQKIAFHRSSMKKYADFLIKEMNIDVRYIESIDSMSDIRLLLPKLKKMGVEHINYIDPVDSWIQKRLTQGCAEQKLSFERFASPLFVNTEHDLNEFFMPDKKKYHQTTFYKDQRKKHSILIDVKGKPSGGKWTFDAENRKKYPKKKVPPQVKLPNSDDYYEEAKSYVNNNFSDHLFSKSNLEPNIVNSIDGATALKLDESYEIKNSEDQSALIDSFESSEENKIKEESLLNQSNTDEIPTGVSIESASYMENNHETKYDNFTLENNNKFESTKEEEYTPKLFSDDQPHEQVEKEDTTQTDSAEQLFDQDTSEDEDFEIPAFLRRQKF